MLVNSATAHSKLLWDTARTEVDSALDRAAETEMGPGQFLKHLMSQGMTQVGVIERVQSDSDGSNARLVRARQRLAFASSLHARLGVDTSAHLGTLTAVCASRVGVFVGAELVHCQVTHRSGGWGVRIADSGSVSYVALGTPADEAGLRIGDTILRIGAEEIEIEVNNSEEVVNAIRALTAVSAETMSDATRRPWAFEVTVARPVSLSAADISTNVMMIRTEQEAADRFAREHARNWRPPLPGTLRNDASGVVGLSLLEIEDRSRWAESERDFSRLCNQQGSVLMLCPPTHKSATTDGTQERDIEQLMPMDEAIRRACAADTVSGSSDGASACFAAMQTVLSEWLVKCKIEPLPSSEALTRVARLILYHLTVKPAMEVCLACKIFPPAMYQPKFLLGCCNSTSGGGCLRVFTWGFVGAPVFGDRPDNKATPYLMRLCSSNLLKKEQPEPEQGLVQQPMMAPPAPGLSCTSPCHVHYHCQVTAAKRVVTAVSADGITWLPLELESAGTGCWEWPEVIPYLANDGSSNIITSSSTSRPGSADHRKGIAPVVPQIAALNPLAAAPTPSVKGRKQIATAPIRQPGVQDNIDGDDALSCRQLASVASSLATAAPPPPIARPGTAAVARPAFATSTGAVALPSSQTEPAAAVAIDLTRQAGQGYGMEISRTCQITGFRGTGTVAERAGVILGSYITHVDDTPVSSDGEIVSILRRMDPTRQSCTFKFVKPLVQPRE